MSERQQRKLGRNMFWLMWIVLLGLLTLYFNNVLDKQYNPNQNLVQQQAGATREVVLVRNKYGHYVATGRINHKPVVFILDTGASDVSIPQATAKRLGLKRGQPMAYQTANGQVINYATRLDSVSLGDLVLQNVPASINPGMHDDEVLLGMSFLKRVEFSQKGNTLTLRQ